MRKIRTFGYSYESTTGQGKRSGIVSARNLEEAKARFEAVKGSVCRAGTLEIRELISGEEPRSRV